MGSQCKLKENLKNILKVKLSNESEEWLVGDFLILISGLVLIYIIKED